MDFIQTFCWPKFGSKIRYSGLNLLTHANSARYYCGQTRGHMENPAMSVFIFFPKGFPVNFFDRVHKMCDRFLELCLLMPTLQDTILAKPGGIWKIWPCQYSYFFLKLPRQTFLIEFTKCVTDFFHGFPFILIVIYGVLLTTKIAVDNKSLTSL